MNKCKCGGYIVTPAVDERNKDYYLGLYICNDCDKRYILKEDKLKPISHAEFRRVILTRIDKE